MQNDKLTTLYSQHTVYLQRVGAGIGIDVIPYLEEIQNGIDEIFKKYEGKAITPKRELTIRAEVNELTLTTLKQYTAYVKQQNKIIGGNESDFAAITLNNVVEDDLNIKSPTSLTVNALAVATPVQLGNNSYSSYNNMLKTYYNQWASQIDGVVQLGFVTGANIDDVSSIVNKEIRLTTSNNSKTVLSRAKRAAKQMSVMGTNHYANVSRIAFVDANEDVLIGYRLVAVLDSRTSQKCRGLDQKVIKKDDSRLPSFTPPLHVGCRTAMVYEVDGRFKLNESDTDRASSFEVDGKRDPKPVGSGGIYYDKMKSLRASDQDDILGPTLGKAFRKMNNPSEFAKATIDTLGNPLTIEQMKSKDNTLGRILRN